MTPHVRHRRTYDVPVTESRSFQFAANGGPPRCARTLRQFVGALEGTAPASLQASIRCGNFLRWIADVFGDNALADQLRIEEQRFRTQADSDVLPEIIDAIRGRYDLTEEGTA